TLQEDLPFKRRTQHPGETQRGETQRGETQRGDTQSRVTQRGEASLQYSPSLVEPLSGAGSQAERLLPPPVQKQSGVHLAMPATSPRTGGGGGRGGGGGGQRKRKKKKKKKQKNQTKMEDQS
ncbi:hypothetical protein CRUP_024676, partial [Coryphaenoides rupestris]